MLAIPVPAKHHKSFGFTRSSFRRQISIKAAISTLVTIERKITISMDVNPHGDMERTKSPMHPHRMPAARTNTGAKTELCFFTYFNRLYRFIYEFLNFLGRFFIQ